MITSHTNSLYQFIFYDIFITNNNNNKYIDQLVNTFSGKTIIYKCKQVNC